MDKRASALEDTTPVQDIAAELGTTVYYGDKLSQSFERLIPLCAAAGDEQGLEYCRTQAERIRQMCAVLRPPPAARA